MKNGLAIVSSVIASLIFAGLVILASGILVQALWNTTVPDIFGLPAINYWQAVRLLVLAYLLISGGSVVTTTRREGK